MSLRLRIGNANFSKLVQYLGYPVLTGLTDLYYLGGSEVLSKKNNKTGGTDATPNGAGSITYEAYAALFDAAADYMTLASSDTTQDVTICAIVKATGKLQILSNLQSALSDNPLGLYFDGTNFKLTTQSAANGNGGSHQHVSIAAPSMATNFYFVAGRVSGAERKIFYGNGGALTSAVNAAANASRPKSSFQLRMGSDGAAGDYASNINPDFTGPGRLAMLSFHKAALSDSDIQSVYDNMQSYYTGKITLA